MKTTKCATMVSLGTGAALIALAFAPITAAYASSGISVSCSSGVGGLIGAIHAANTAGGGTIHLASGCTYTLTQPDNTNTMFGANGLPVVTSNIAVNGNGATIARSPESTKPFRIWAVAGPAGGSLSIQNLTITGGLVATTTAKGPGSVGGGGIANDAGTVTLNHTQVTDNQVAGVVLNPNSQMPMTTGPAGGIFSLMGLLVLNNSQVSGNTAFAGGGGIASAAGTVTLNSSEVTDNSGAEGPGGGIAGIMATVSLNNSAVTGNMAPNGGGGGIVNAGGTLTLNSSQVSGNTSANGGGIASGNGNGSVGGGGVLTLNRSQVTGNTATAAGSPDFGPALAAGGIANGGSAVFNNSEVNDNMATGADSGGGGIVNHGAMTINKSEVNGNMAPGGVGGGGIVNLNAGLANGSGVPVDGTGVLTINNSQLSGDMAPGGVGGGILNFSSGLPVQLTVNHSQLSLDSAAAGGAIFTDDPATVALTSTSFDGNSPDNCEPPGTIPGCVG